LATTNHWRTVAHCTQPEPRHLLQSDQKTLESSESLLSSAH